MCMLGSACGNTETTGSRRGHPLLCSVVLSDQHRERELSSGLLQEQQAFVTPEAPSQPLNTTCKHPDFPSSLPFDSSELSCTHTSSNGEEVL